MRETSFDAIAEVEFFLTSQGGREGPTPENSYRCIFDIDGKFFDCVLILDELGNVRPGQRVTVPLKFLFPELVKPKLFVGKSFYLKEIVRVAEGEIIELIEDNGA